MRFEQIQYFLAVAETGNFSRAAEQLLISQPSLSSAIRKLERELGVILFERGGRRTQLTPPGQVFLEKAQKLLEDYEQLRYQLRDFKQQPILRLGLISTLRLACLSPLIHSFRQQYPDVILELRSSHFEDLNSWLINREIDLAITALLEEKPNPQTTYSLFNQQLKLAVSENHPFTEQEIVNLSDLNNQPYIERINCEFWRGCPNLYESAGVYPNIIYRADCEEWVISLIQAGWGMSVMPQWQNLSGIVYCSVVGINLNRTIGLKWNEPDSLEVIEQFCSVARQQDWQLI
jgi:DNA-binding transcriptional LysR family regulator